MYMILIGGGKVGYHLAKALLAEGHEVLVIERDRVRIDFICNELGSICLLGDGCEASVQAEAGITWLPVRSPSINSKSPAQLPAAVIPRMKSSFEC
jgi:Trk K+ transport system NAD-binding subunit